MRLVRGMVLDGFGAAGVSVAQQRNMDLLGYLSTDEKNRLVTEMLERSGDESRRHAGETEDLRKAYTNKVEQLVNSHESALRDRQEKHDVQLTNKNAELDEERREKEYWRQQVRERNAELSANREESRLELRQDMLLAVGEVLQSAFRQDDSGELAGDVKAGLALALRAGGAEPLETPGTMVEYNPELHDSKGGLPASGPSSGKVMVVAPGVVYRGGIHGDRVLLKAHVRHEAG